MTAPAEILTPAGIPARQEVAFRDLRRLSALSERGYQAGEATGANRNFHPRRSTGDADIKRGMRLIIDRCRDQAINNPSIRGAIRRIVNNAVRDGIAPRFRFRTSSGDLDTAANRAWEALFGRWATYAGLNRRQSLWTMQRLALSTMWSDGEFYVHRVYDDRIPGVPPLRLELIERDMLATHIDGEIEGGALARCGKEIDRRTGEFVAYHFLTQHPGDYNATGYRHETRRIPASEIIDVHEADRISQTMGISWLASLVMESFDLQEYRDYERIGAKLAAAFGVFVRNNNPTANPLGGIGVVPGNGPDWPGSWGQVNPLPDYIEPGRIQALPLNTDIVIASHNRPGGAYAPYVTESRRTQSTGLGISYEAFANDYTGASYSSARSGALEERLTYQGLQFFLSEAFLDPVVRWFIESAWTAGLNPSPMPGFADNPWPYLESFVQANPGWQWVDPRNDATAGKLKIDNALSSRHRETMQAGVDFDAIVDELILEEEKLARLYELRAANARRLEGGMNADAS